MSQNAFVGFSDTSSRLVALNQARDEAKQEMVGALACAHNKQAIVAALDAEIRRLRELERQELRQWLEAEKAGERAGE